MDLNDIPNEVTCGDCGSTAAVTRLQCRHGEQLIITRMNGKFYVKIECPKCGQAMYEVDLPTAK
jgi:phage FluMu protein Com